MQAAPGPAGGRRVVLVPNGEYDPRIAMRMVYGAPYKEVVRAIGSKLALISGSQASIDDAQLERARFYLKDGSMVTDFDVLEKDDLLFVAFAGQPFIPRGPPAPPRHRPPTHVLPPPGVAPPNRRFVKDRKEQVERQKYQEEEALAGNRIIEGAALDLKGGAAGAAGPGYGVAGAGPAVGIMSRGGVGGLATDGPASRAFGSSGGADKSLVERAKGCMCIKDSSKESRGLSSDGKDDQGKVSEGPMLWKSAALAVLVIMACAAAWMLLDAAVAAVTTRFTAPSCEQLGSPAGCKPLPRGCHPPPPWMLPLLESAAEEALERMPTPPFPPAAADTTLPLDERSWHDELLWAHSGERLSLRRAAVQSLSYQESPLANSSGPLIELGACWAASASRAQLVPDGLVFRFYGISALLAAEYAVLPSTGHDELGEFAFGRRRALAARPAGGGAAAAGSAAGGGGAAAASGAAGSGAVAGRRRPLWLSRGGGSSESGLLSRWAQPRGAELPAEGGEGGGPCTTPSCWAEWGAIELEASGGLYLDHIPLVDRGRAGVNVSGCSGAFEAAAANATRAGGGGEEYGGRVEASAARSSLASSVAPLLCDWISATNMSGDPLRDAATSAFLAANPAEAWADEAGHGRIGAGGAEAGGASARRQLAAGGGAGRGVEGAGRGVEGAGRGGEGAGRSLAYEAEYDQVQRVVAGSNDRAIDNLGLGASSGGAYLAGAGASGPWRGMRREMDASLDAVMPLLLAKADYITRVLCVLVGFVAFLTAGVVLTFCRCGAADNYQVGAGSCCCLKIEGYESASGGACCCVAIREVPKPRRKDDGKDCFSVIHHCIHVCDCCDKCCD
ncbi:hypothetical protein EMIHUDRAFT_110061 [Emiliania huxleyi CCMP1516]|uniref:Uncharacterized protein n=2 Tax=Emiliania huxleyi TaxID=2903 RepID=A0A0D3KMS2_EMIH1|nr:hypothetical protein EMIHUDRAFT_110061 [Emiliania huxleyi CCMP1516]EOD37057.1 hypothetical protein EMIHUDRAFT_110061 [Emiliania huxleyi CCMP1516]|eukprot:XP_005789486.1 hypothetical protein EMIHUDRAFT_110061 [Emiliania huxleyi CCMP1516]